MTRRRALGEACPITSIRVVPYTKAGKELIAVDFELMAGERKIGSVMTAPYGSSLQVQASEIDEGHRRCGYGTKLYTAAAKYACDNGMTLESDSVRSIDSHSFWKKQERKGRATCTGLSKESARDVGRGPRYGRDDCETYRLRACPITDLSGRRKRRK